MRWTGEAIDKVYDEVAPTGRDELGMVTREPLGIIAAIVPWNFPLLMAIWKIAPALAMGNSVILKPSEKSPNRSEEHTSELQSLMRSSYAVFCLKKNKLRQSHIMSQQNQYYINTTSYIHTFV